MSFVEVWKDLDSESCVYVEAVRDAAGFHGLFLLFPNSSKTFFILRNEHEEFDSFVQKLFESPQTKVCFDLRNITKMMKDPWSSQNVFDVFLLFGGTENLRDLTKKTLKEEDFKGLADASRTYEAHVKASRIAKIDLTKYSEHKIIPSKILLSLYKMKGIKTLALYQKKLLSEPGALSDHHRVLRTVYSVYKMESNGIKIDQSVLSGDRNFMVHMRSKFSNGFVHSMFDPLGGATGRIKVMHGTFNCMSIPKKERKAFVSRFNGGKIASFDFNAIDYRCIIAHVPELTEKYRDSEDFHRTTAELAFGSADERSVAKALTYIKLYGGSPTTAASALGITLAEVNRYFDKLGALFEPIERFKKKLHAENPIDHPGAILGRFAQSEASRVFKSSVGYAGKAVNTAMKSLMIFTVHDEIVIDVHPKDVQRLKFLAPIIESAANQVLNVGFRVKLSIGSNYGELIAIQR